MRREHPRGGNQHDQSRANQAHRSDRDRRAARRNLWAQPAAAAGYGEHPACSQDGAA